MMSRGSFSPVDNLPTTRGAFAGPCFDPTIFVNIYHQQNAFAFSSACPTYPFSDRLHASISNLPARYVQTSAFEGGNQTNSSNSIALRPQQEGESGESTNHSSS